MYRLCEKQIVESVFKTVHAKLLFQAQSLVSLFLLLAWSWLVRLVCTEEISWAQSVFGSIPVVVRNVFLSFKRENLGVRVYEPIKINLVGSESIPPSCSIYVTEFVVPQLRDLVRFGCFRYSEWCCVFFSASWAEIDGFVSAVFGYNIWSK